MSHAMLFSTAMRDNQTGYTNPDQEAPGWELASLPSRPDLRQTKSDQSLLVVTDAEVPEDKRSLQPKVIKKRTFFSSLFKTSTDNVKGWTVGLRWATIGVLTCFVINLILTIVALKDSGNLTGVGTLFTGKCTKVKGVNTLLHVFINILSTALLSSSNYVMQCLGAPNRAQIDKAHAAGKSLDIGLPSIRNLIRIGWRRPILWLVLWLSSFPLHFFWNSVVFSTLQANQFVALVVANDFETAQFDCSAEYMNWTADSYTTTNSVSCSVAQDFQTGLKTMNMERLENKACLTAYSSSFLSGRRNLIMVTNTTAAMFDSSHTNRSTVFGARNSTTWNQRLGMTDLWLPDRWPCYFSTANLDSINTDKCSASSVAADPAGWQVELQSGNFAIEYCLSQVVPEQCRLQSLPVLLLGVTCFNLLKLISMIVGALVLNDRPIMVLGDAAASFLQNPVRETEGKCLWGREDFKKTLWQRFRHWVLRKPYDLTSLPYEYDGDRLRWSDAAPGGDWRFYYLCCFIVLFFASYIAASVFAGSSSEIFKLQIGQYSYQTIGELVSGVFTPVEDFPSAIQMVMAANTPQVLFVFFYYMSNRLLTCMLGAYELSRFSFRRRTLRVSYPVGEQRSTYWLSVPFRYSIPLLIVSTLTHFFISESLFVVRIWVYDWQGNIGGGYANGAGGPYNNQLGYSAPATITSLILIASILTFVIAMGFKRFPTGLPVVGNNSLAISAACHPLADDVDVAEKSVMWGAVYHESGDTPGHCCFSSLDVEPPIVGQLYAGVRKE
ncbi:hypothetical protein BP6252_03517 [Coleophoma cylindrospora]|uniref:DUF6536 domain-containing protein n=1 Tax=Coleophoma cylindrospora TaxID=1849047 RepID=A0A3D8S7V4_9HELO|nr:hypothetical protein BP6252_03517 [Coleophoma cylindrospora]